MEMFFISSLKIISKLYSIITNMFLSQIEKSTANVSSTGEQELE